MKKKAMNEDRIEALEARVEHLEAMHGRVTCTHCGGIFDIPEIHDTTVCELRQRLQALMDVIEKLERKEEGYE